MEPVSSRMHYTFIFAYAFDFACIANNFPFMYSQKDFVKSHFYYELYISITE